MSQTLAPCPTVALVLEDIPEVSEWLVTLLPTLFPGVQVHAAPTLLAARWFLESGLPFDLGLIDLALPDGNGTEIIRELAASRPACSIVVTTLFADDEFLFPALRAGAQGYLLKDQPPDKFAAALRGILDGEPPLSPMIAHRLLNMFRAVPEAATGAESSSLTPREREVLTLVAKGYRVQQLAECLSVSKHTVSDHLKSVYRKLKISSRAEAALEAARLGLIHSA